MFYVYLYICLNRQDNTSIIEAHFHGVDVVE